MKPAEVKENLVQKALKVVLYIFKYSGMCVGWVRSQGKSNEISPFLMVKVTASQQLCDSKFPGLSHPTVCCLSRCKSW